MSNKKKNKVRRQQLMELELVSLLAVAKKHTRIPHSEINAMSKDQAVECLVACGCSLTEAFQQEELRSQLRELSRAQLVALGRQRTMIPFPTLLEMTNDALVERLVQVEDALVPRAA
jgi:hypothetical protein